jgi:hypothetical protein
MRHARQTSVNPITAWPTAATTLVAVGGSVLAATGGSGVTTDVGAGLAGSSALVGGLLAYLRQREDAARIAALHELRTAEQADFAVEIARRDGKLDELSDEIALVREQSAQLTRRLDETRTMADEEQVERVRLEGELARFSGWTRHELSRATEALQATRDQLESTLLRAATAEYELAQARAADAVAQPSEAIYLAARRTLDQLWSARTDVVVHRLDDVTVPEPPEIEVLDRDAVSLDAEVREPVAEPYLIDALVSGVAAAEAEFAAARAESADAPAVGVERLYRPFVVGKLTELGTLSLLDARSEEDETTATAAADEHADDEATADVPALALDDTATLPPLDLTAHDETVEFGVRELRAQEQERAAI